MYPGRHAIDGMTVERLSLPAMRPDELERRLRERLDALGPAPRASSCSPTSSGPIGSAANWRNPKTRTFAELLIDCEEDRTLRASGCRERLSEADYLRVDGNRLRVRR
jgi:hypothetical protein